MKTISTTVTTVMIAALALSFSGCATADPSRQSEANGTVMGAALGGVLGGAIGHNAGDRHNTLLGVVLGATIGGLVGNQMGQQQDAVRSRYLALEQAQNTVTMMVRDSNGSYTPVVLRRYGYLFVGPRGEYYTVLPSDDQLRPLYGF